MTPVAAEDQKIGRRGSSTDTGGAEGVGFGFQQKRAAGCQLIAERLRGQGQTVALG